MVEFSRRKKEQKKVVKTLNSIRASDYFTVKWLLRFADYEANPHAWHTHPC
jgi:predicted adenine nucleotide alpha hydrolase (AANH) superfamily ATPase